MSLSRNLYLNLIKDDRYMYLVKGLGNTLLITIVAVVVGILLGFLLAYIRTTHDKTGKWKAANLIAHVYITVIRGTPMVLQLLIVYFVVFASVNVPKIIVAFIAFGLNSGAYVAEIIRAGLMSIDEGQYEAGASLGFSYTQTMLYFILPQAIKNVLPALGNEMIVLLKETSVAGYIAMDDLTRGADIIRSQTYSAFTPLLIAAAIYLFFVLIFDSLVKKLERNLKNSDH
ncbi:MAG: amino acid ABC transporter permease [Lachnospiraceae bacterium]|nr:amino acid ABC transporter permease [Lachnospiraceae bacterium]MBQ8667251.1 amino acid ABC transporter permease [Lachnospiraceae bacterium]